MGSMSMVWHFAGLALPPAVMALALIGAARWWGESGWPWWKQWLVHLSVLWPLQWMVLVWRGVDGTMTAYLGMVVAAATVQWLLSLVAGVRPGISVAKKGPRDR